LKDVIKKGEKTVADVRSPDYNPQLFVHTAKSIQRYKRDNLENTSIQVEDFIDEINSEA